MWRSRLRRNWSSGVYGLAEGGAIAWEAIMSITAVAGSMSQLSNIQSHYQQVRSQFKQLGQDLQSGNLTQAQTDFVTLSQSFASQLGSQGSFGKMLSSVGQALRSGNLSAAQQAFSSLTQVGASAIHHHSHVPPMAGAMTQGLQQLGQALQSGDLSAAQQAYSALQQVWQQMSNVGGTQADTPTPTSTTSVTA